MYGGKSAPKLPCVLVDLNTQLDFFDANGACPVLEPDLLYARLRRVVAWVKRNHAPVISSMDAHRISESGDSDSSAPWCIEGTHGQGKLDFTLLPNRIFIAGDNTIAVPIDLFSRHQQVIFPQRSEDLFANPKADRFITQQNTDEFIVFGAVSEHEVKAIVLGLLARNKSVSVLLDGCGAWSYSESDLSIRQMTAKGANIITVDELVSRKLHRRWRYTADCMVRAHRAIPYASPDRIRDLNGSSAPLNGRGSNGHGGKSSPKDT